MSVRGPLTTQLVAGPAGERLEIDRAELQVVAGPDKGTTLALGPDSVCIGSGPECDLVLRDRGVSRRHAEIVATARGYALRDLGSKNGLLVGGLPVERLPVGDGLTVRMGETTLRVRAIRGRHVVSLARPGLYESLVAHSVKMRAVVAALERLAETDTSVLLVGETGTGKEVAAHALHRAGARRNGPFRVFDCGAAQAGVIASDLFGHEAGAFTGAAGSRPGLIDEAEGGTLFLDEIGELPLELQPLLLRAIERRVTRRVGGQREHVHDVRFVAATNRNLAEEVRLGRFRPDLYFRLSVVVVRIPPLRERPEDLPLLASLFAREAGVALSPELVALLGANPWPGNVRELRNTITRIAVQPDAGLLPPFDGREAGPSGEPWLPLEQARRRVVDAFERRYLVHALARAGGAVTRAAAMAGITRQFFTRLARRHGVTNAREPPDVGEE